jgi:hypothetical protein
MLCTQIIALFWWNIIFKKGKGNRESKVERTKWKVENRKLKVENRENEVEKRESKVENRERETEKRKSRKGN